MIGLADSFMNASRFRADQEARMRDAEMRQRQMAMQEAQHRMQMEEGGLRMGQMRRQDQALQEYMAGDQSQAGMPTPQAAIAADPYAGQPAGQAQFMEANGAAPAATGLPVPKGGKYDAARKFARSKGDVKTDVELGEREKAEGRDEGRKAELKRLMAMKPEEIESMWKGVNRDGSGVNMMLKFDPKSRQFLLTSEEQGIPTRSFSQAELVNDMMAMWEAGNGDTMAGMNALMASAKRRREMQDQDFARSGDVAKANSGAYFKGLEDDNDSARLGLQRAGMPREVPKAIQQEMLDIEQKYISSTNPQERALLERQYQMVLSRAGAAIGRPMGLPNQRGPQAGGMSEKDLTDAALKLMERDPKLSFQGAKTMLSGNYDPMAAFKQALTGGGAPADGQPSIQAPTPGNRILGAGERPNVTRGMPAREAVDPARLVRTAKRGLMGGVEYVYQDPATGKTYSTEQYNQLIGQ